MSKHSLNLLIVGLSDIEREKMMNYCSQYSFKNLKPHFVNTFKDLLSTFNEVNPECVLIDDSLQDCDLMSVAQKLRISTEGMATPILLLTDKEDNVFSVKAKRNGFSEMVLKKELNGYLLGKAIEFSVDKNEAVEKAGLKYDKLALAMSISEVGLFDWFIEKDEFIFDTHSMDLFGFKYGKTGITLKVFLDKINPLDFDKIRTRFESAVNTGDEFSINFRLIEHDKNVKKLFCKIRVIRDLNGKAVQFEGVCREESEMEEHIQKDALTNLPSRESFMGMMKLSLEKVKKNKSFLALLHLDFSDVKKINDTLGRKEGDDSVKQISERLKEFLGPNDLISRYSGMEFIISLTEMSDSHQVSSIATKIVSELKKPFKLETHEITINFNIGIAVYPFAGETIDDLTLHADAALSHSRDQGKNNYQYFSEVMNKQNKRKQIIEEELKTAIEKRELIVNYLPQMDFASNKIIGIKVKRGWNNPKLGDVKPTEFMPIAAELGMVDIINDWVLNQINNLLSDLRDKVGMAVNELDNLHIWMSTYNLSLEYSELLAKGIEYAKIDPERVIIEIHEEALRGDFNELKLALDATANMGCRLAIGDFGKGASSLERLKKLPLHAIKIDNVIVQDLEVDPNNAAIIRAIIQLGRAMNYHVVAGGVVTREQYDFLKEEDCEYGSGEYFSKPVSADMLTVYIQKYI